MHVAFVNQPLDGILPPNQNSIGIWTYEVARRLTGAADVTVYGKYTRAMSDNGDPRVVRDQGVTYRFVRSAPNRIWSKISDISKRVMKATKPMYASPLFYLDYSLQVAVDLRRRRPDVIHIHNFTGFVPVIRALNPAAKLVLHMNCEWLSQLDEKRMKRRIRSVDAVIGSSDHITNLVRARFPALASRCQTVYNGVDVDSFEVTPLDATGTQSLLFVGRVSPEKGLHDLFDALPVILDGNPGAKMDVVGPADSLPLDYIVGVSDDALVQGLRPLYDRPYIDILHDKIDPRHAERIVFHGAQPHADVVEFVRGATLLVNPSYSESFGMSLVEAMACERSVIATSVGGMKEIVVDGETGRLVDPSDPQQLASAINELLADRELIESMGRAGRQRVLSLFSWDRISERSLELYAELGPARSDDPPPGDARS